MLTLFRPLPGLINRQPVDLVEIGKCETLKYRRKLAKEENNQRREVNACLFRAFAMREGEAAWVLSS